MIRDYILDEVKVKDIEDRVRQSYILKCLKELPRCFGDRFKSNYTCEVYDRR